MLASTTGRKLTNHHKTYLSVQCDILCNCCSSVPVTYQCLTTLLTMSNHQRKHKALTTTKPCRRGWSWKAWLVQHTAPVRAIPDGRPCLQRVRYKYPTSAHFLHIPPNPTRHAYTSTHLPMSPPPWASTLDHYKVSALRSRVASSCYNIKKKKGRVFI